MSCSRCECAYLSLIIAIIAGVVLGVLYALGVVATGIVFWVFLAIGILGVFLAPIYAASDTCINGDGCFCSYRRIFFASAVGAIVTATAGLIVAALDSVVATAIVLGLATFFSVLLVASTICLARCLCNR